MGMIRKVQDVKVMPLVLMTKAALLRLNVATLELGDVNFAESL